MSRTHTSVALSGEVYQRHIKLPKHSGAGPQESRTWRPTRSPKDRKTHGSNRLRFVLDDAQPNPVAMTNQFDHELQRGVKSKWWTAMKQNREKTSSINAIEPLLVKIRSAISGIKILNIPSNVTTAFADDITVAITDQGNADTLFEGTTYHTHIRKVLRSSWNENGYPGNAIHTTEAHPNRWNMATPEVWRILNGKLDLTQIFNIEETHSLHINHNDCCTIFEDNQRNSSKLRALDLTATFIDRVAVAMSDQEDLNKKAGCLELFNLASN
ncbi:uncharacterized protein VTP21DRAFT_11275 [Calcarisporiella thermophila]|uniref:uncharacterized protein n=1 Tax=Calcarisporiella thermophila TaxID=911321 RepID=UPI0037447B36